MEETTVNDLMPTTPDLNAERLAKLKELFPDLFAENGTLNPDELKALIGPDDTAGRERYEFNWNGKRESKRKAFTPSTATLIYDEVRSVNPENAGGNLIIEGENLETLKCLLSAYREKIKCIYIDPPYNTGKDFVYSDNYTADRKAYWEETNTEEGVNVDTNADSNGRFHSDWLSMMHPRLLLARQMMRKDGYLFVSIDDAEYASLKRLLDEVFGESNFLATLVWDKNRKNDAKFFSVGHEYMLVYAKEKDFLKESGVILRAPKDGIDEARELFETLKEKHKENWAAVQSDWRAFYAEIEDEDPRKPLGRFSKVDERGPYRDDGNINWPGGGGPRYEVLHPETKKPCKIPVSGWRYPTPERFWEEYEAGHIVFGDDESTVPSVRSNLFEKDVQVMRSVMYSYAQTATQRFNELFDGKRVFENPKHYEDIRRIVDYVTDKDDLVLDFFGGSGTTGHAAMDLNREDGGNRRFILVQLPEQTQDDSEAYKAGYKTISEITIDRNKRVIERMTAEAAKEPDLFDGEFKAPGFKVYRLAKSTFPRVDFSPNPEKSEAENVEALKRYIEEKERVLFADFDQSTVFDEVLLKNGFMLNYTLEKQEAFKENVVHLADDGEKAALVCLDNRLENSTIEQLSKDWKFICLERALDTTKKWNLRNQLGEQFIAF